MTCINNCRDQTVTCAKSKVEIEPHACQRIRKYLNMSDIDINSVQMQCNRQSCNVSCDEGFGGDDVMYLWNDSHNCCTPTGGQEITCEKGLILR